eukprot:5383073-Pyramimonas_sp.AAC.1
MPDVRVVTYDGSRVGMANLEAYSSDNLIDLEWPELGFAVPALRPSRCFSTDLKRRASDAASGTGAA